MDAIGGLLDALRGARFAVGPADEQRDDHGRWTEGGGGPLAKSEVITGHVGLAAVRVQVHVNPSAATFRRLFDQEHYVRLIVKGPDIAAANGQQATHEEIAGLLRDAAHPIADRPPGDIARDGAATWTVMKYHTADHQVGDTGVAVIHGHGAALDRATWPAGLRRAIPPIPEAKGGFDPNQPRDDHGRWGGGGAGTAKAMLAAAEAKKAGWIATSRHTSIEAHLHSTPANQATLVAAGAAIRHETGAEFVNPGAKAPDRIIAKLNRPGRSAARLTDAVRAGFKVTTPDQANAVVAALGKRFDVADEGWQTTAEGYFDRKVTIRFADGQIGEVQLWHPAMYQMKEHGGGHDLYMAGQALSANHPGRVPIVAAMKTIYARVVAGLSDEWKALAGKGGS